MQKNIEKHTLGPITLGLTMHDVNHLFEYIIVYFSLALLFTIQFCLQARLHVWHYISIG